MNFYFIQKLTIKCMVNKIIKYMNKLSVVYIRLTKFIKHAIIIYMDRTINLKKYQQNILLDNNKTFIFLFLSWHPN